MKVKIIAFGKIKEKYLQDGINEYVKRLKTYCKLEIIELPEIRLNDNPSLKQIEKALDDEAMLVDKYLNNMDSYLIILDLHGKEMNNLEYNKLIQDNKLNGKSTFIFLIGSSFGLSDKIRKKANFKWSFSKLTFTHQMIRMMLLEQIYRGFKIENNEPYHK